MNARENILSRLLCVRGTDTPDRAAQALDAYRDEVAHELAERQRAAAHGYVSHQREGMELGADLIDPQSEGTPWRVVANYNGELPALYTADALRHGAHWGVL